MGGGILYFPCSYKNDLFEVFDNLFILHKNGDIEKIVTTSRDSTDFEIPRYCKRLEVLTLYIWDI